MRATSIALVALLAIGCTTRQRIAGGGAAMAVTGVYLGFSTETKDDNLSTRDKVGIGFLITGLAVLFVSAALEESDARDDHKPIEIKAKPVAKGPDPALVHAQQKREQAWGLTKQAQEAARVNDCAKVAELSAQVGAVDRDFYADVFMKDVAIQQCFQPKGENSAPPPPPPPTTPTATTP